MTTTESDGATAPRPFIFDVAEIEGHNLDPVWVLRLAAAMGARVRRLLVVGCEPGPPGEVEEMATWKIHGWGPGLSHEV